MLGLTFKDKFIGYADVIGFKALVEAAEAGNATGLKNAREVLAEFGSLEKRQRLAHRGPKICPRSTYIQRDLDFRVAQISDSLLISCEVSPAGVINVIEHCWTFVFSLLQKGIMCRGYITRGHISHEADLDFVGTGANKAFEREKNVAVFKRDAEDRGTPFVEIDETVVAYINICGDQCVRELFSRFTSCDGGLVALFPFQRLAHRFLIGGFGKQFDAGSERSANQNVRLMLVSLKERISVLVDTSKPDAVRKAQHYIQALNVQLAVCDRTDALINQLDDRASE